MIPSASRPKPKSSSPVFSPGSRFYLRRNLGPKLQASLVIPGSCDEAKQLLRDSVKRVSSLPLPPRPPKKQVDPTATPVTSRVEMICHGCHGPVGDGAHQGSATGKNRCSLQHYASCQGGVPESENWRSCPIFIPGSQREAQLGNPGQPQQLYASPGVAGFTQTLSETQFGNGMQQNQAGFNGQPSSSTPAVTFHDQQDGAVAAAAPADQFQIIQDGNPPGDPLWEERLRQRPRVDYYEAVDLSTVSPTQRAQQHVQDLRAVNQAATGAIPKVCGEVENGLGVNIADLRANPNLRAGVEQHIQVIRGDVPTLSAAPSARAPLPSDPMVFQFQQPAPMADMYVAAPSQLSATVAASFASSQSAAHPTHMSASALPSAPEY